MARIELKNIQKRWGGFWAVRDVDIDIADKEFLVLLGPSGCGKTTTMRMIAGLEEPSDGEIFMNGAPINELDARDRDVAMVFQGYALYPNMTIYENIRFPLRMRDVPRIDHDHLVRKAAEMVELADFLDRKPAKLSGGQRQRAALARAIVRQPQCFLMDEPLSNLDARLRAAMRVQIKHLQRQLKITTVYVTHDQIEAMTLADRIVIMNQGKIQQIGTPDDIYSNPSNSFVAGFIGSPPMNLIDGQLLDGAFHAPGLKIGEIQTDRLPAAHVTLGIRPEDCRITTMEDADEDQLRGRIFGVEPTGDQTYVSIKIEAGMIEVKADRRFRADLDTTIQVRFDRDQLFFFETQSGRRVQQTITQP